MSFIGISVPSVATEKLLKLKVPGDKEDEKELHITLCYFEQEMDMKSISKIMEILSETFSDIKPFTVSTKILTNFPQYNDEPIPIIAKVEGGDLFDLHDKIKKDLDSSSIKYSKTFKDFKPHITLAYADKEIKLKNFHPIEFEVNEITFFCGDYKSNNLNVDFKLGIPKKKAAIESKISLFEQIIK